MSIANSLTLFRLFIGPIFLFVYTNHETFSIPITVLPYILLLLFTLSELSDALDGYFARRFNQVTALGKILDPMADSIYRISVFLTFTLPPVKLPMILIFIFLYRDSVISTLRTICAFKGLALGARPSGKLKAVIQAIAGLTIIIFLIPYSQGYMSEDVLHNSSTWVATLAAIYTLISGAEYIYTHRSFIKMMVKSD